MPYTYTPMLKIRTGVALAALLLIVLISGSCRKGTNERDEPPNVVVATVNGKPIRGDVFLKEYRLFKKRIKLTDVNDEELEKQMRDGILDSIIRDGIIAGEAEKAGIRISKELENDAIQSLLKGFSQERLQVILEKQNQSYDDWKDSVRKNLLVKKLIDSKIAPQVDVPDAEVKKYFDDHPDDYKKPSQAHVYHILCVTFAEADKARQALADGADFGATARKFSKSPEAPQGGDLGMVSQGQMPKELDDVIFRLKEKEVSGVVESPYGFHLIRVTEFSKPGQMSYTDAKEQIYSRLFQDQLEKKFEEWIQEIRKNAKIEIFTDRLYRL